MDKLEKLLDKASSADRDGILETMRLIKSGRLSILDIKKIRGSELFRVRTGKYRVFFYHDDKIGTNVIVDVRFRNENTY